MNQHLAVSSDQCERDRLSPGTSVAIRLIRIKVAKKSNGPLINADRLSVLVTPVRVLKHSLSERNERSAAAARFVMPFSICLREKRFSRNKSKTVK